MHTPRLSSLVALVVFALCLAVPNESIAQHRVTMDVDDAGAVRATSGGGVRFRASGHWTRTATGTGLLAGAWGLNLLGSMFAGHCPPEIHTTPDRVGCREDGAWEDFRIASGVPLVGPWIQLAMKPSAFDDDLWGVWLVAAGLVQLAGITLLLVELTRSREDRTRDRALSLSVAPAAGRDAAGLMLGGRF